MSTLEKFEVHFPLGRVLATPGALDAISHEMMQVCIGRHASGDWGDLDANDSRMNEAALKRGDRIFSSYDLAEGLTIWVITEADRSATTVLLPSEY